MDTPILEKNLVQIYNGKFRPVQRSARYGKVSKVIVLDLDETMGEFSAMVLLWKIAKLQKDNIETFTQILDHFPEFLRYGIMTILEYIWHKKTKDKCAHIYLYTNNLYSPEFPQMITQYFSAKIGATLFDKVICAFKVGDQIIEPLRTSHRKSHGDFIQCTLLPKSTEICFIDDAYHNKMNHDKIYYIQPAPYTHSLSADTIAERAHTLLPEFFPDQAGLANLLRPRDKTDPYNYELHSKVSQKIMYYIKEFFYLTTLRQKTKKFQKKTTRITRKQSKVPSDS
jgi:hypothetical protein